MKLLGAAGYRLPGAGSPRGCFKTIESGGLLRMDAKIGRGWMGPPG